VVPERDDESRLRALRLAAQFQQAYAEALLGGAPRAAETVIREAIEAGLDEAMIDDEVIRPALQLVGDLWADGRLSVAEEHLATSISMRIIVLQREAFRASRQRVSQRILLAGAQGEQHVVGLQMAASLILSAGYDVRLLGADLPVGEIASAMRTHEPSVVGFTTASSLTSVRMPSAFEAVRAVSPDVGILVGGRGVEEAWGARWDIVICRHVADAVEEVDALVKRARGN
jgi:methanogenic corrinoid protein MtbC1